MISPLLLFMDLFIWWFLPYYYLWIYLFYFGYFILIHGVVFK